jgi:putative endonuclease
VFFETKELWGCHPNGQIALNAGSKGPVKQNGPLAQPRRVRQTRQVRLDWLERVPDKDEVMKMAKAKYTVYILKSTVDGKLYTGHTSDLEKRMQAHNRGAVKSTRHRRPLILVHQETFKTKAEAFGREMYLKGLEGGRIKQKLISDKETFFK